MQPGKVGWGPEQSGLIGQDGSVLLLIGQFMITGKNVCRGELV